MKVYISGPISGEKYGNKVIFYMYQRLLENHGYEVVNPHEIEPLYIKGRGPWASHMAADIRALVGCDLVFIFAEKQSRGVALEKHIAQELNIPVVVMTPGVSFLEQIKRGSR